MIHLDLVPMHPMVPTLKTKTVTQGMEMRMEEKREKVEKVRRTKWSLKNDKKNTYFFCCCIVVCVGNR